MSALPVVIPLRLPPVRYGAVIVASALLAVGVAKLSTEADLARPSLTNKSRAIGRVLMSVDRIAGVWPIAAVLALAFFTLGAFLLWAMMARRPFALVLDARGISWPSLAPWVTPFFVAWSDVASVEPNVAGDHLVIRTTTRRRTMPAWWLPDGTSVADVVKSATAMRA